MLNIWGQYNNTKLDALYTIRGQLRVNWGIIWPWMLVPNGHVWHSITLCWQSFRSIRQCSKYHWPLNSKASENRYLSGHGVREQSIYKSRLTLIQHDVSTYITTSSLQHNLPGLNFDLTIIMVMVQTMFTIKIHLHNHIKHLEPIQQDKIGHTLHYQGSTKG